MSLSGSRGALWLAFLLILAAGLPAQTCTPGELRVIVLDSQEGPVFDVEVGLSSDAGSLEKRSTQTTGIADFKGIPCGAWNVTANKEGFESKTQSVQIASGANLEISLVLTPKMQVTSVEVTDSAPRVEQSASANNELHLAEVKTLPTNPATVNDTLPLVPGVVRAQNGELKIDGTGQERSAMVVNQTDITDPSTGRFGQTIPVDSIETVNVLQTPFLAQYGRFTQSVIAVETRRGGEKWHAELNDPFPDFRIRSYHMHGIRNETPRFVVGGPVRRDSLYFISSLQYFLQKDPSRTLPFPYNESKQESVNSFTQLDWIASDKQIVSATFHFSPQHTNFVNPDYFHPEPVTPSYAQHNYVGTVADHLAFAGGILDSSGSVQRYDVTVGAQGPGDMFLTPEGNRGNFFGEQLRSSQRLEWIETWSLSPFKLLGTHLIKMGTYLTRSSNDGRFTYHPVNILDSAGQIEERIDFTNQNAYSRRDLEVTAYVQDHWSLTPQVSLDYGARLEHQRLASSLRVAPRAGIGWSPRASQRTVLRAGYGLFYDHLPLDIYTFGRYPLRTITLYDASGALVGGPVDYANVIGSVTGPRSFFVHGQQVAGAFSPRGTTLNLQVEHSFSPRIRLRAVYTDNQSVGLIVFEPDLLGAANEIVLNGDGNSRYRQLEVTGKFAWRDGQQLILSYTRSRAEGNLNAFDGFLGNFPAPLIHPNLYSNLPGDIPNRFLLWGRLKTHVWGLTVLPIVEYRNGFPYAVMDAMQNYVGTPYRDGTRFRNFFSADARFMKDFKTSKKYTLRISLTASNITNHFNPLAIHDNIADPQYGVSFGNYHRRYRGGLRGALLRLAGSRWVPTLAAVLVFAAVLAAGIYGIGRSLWLDEAWTANSIREPSLGGLFHYPGWLQVNPPLFLVLARGVVGALGLSSVSLRVLPLTLALAGFVALLAAGRRLLSPALALLAATLVMLDPTAIEYSHTLKPYTGEIAASAALLLVAILYLQDRDRFKWLVAAAIVTLPLAYPSVFLLPGIVLAVYFTNGMRRAAVLAVAAGVVLVPEYWFFIRPNLSPQLRDFWAVDVDHHLTVGLAVAVLFCVVVAGALLKRKPDARTLAQMVCVLPCLLLAVSGVLGWYPVSHRTRLFALPCLALLIAMVVEDTARRFLTPAVEAALLAIAVGFAGAAVANQMVQHRDRPEENFAAAVPFLQSHVAPGDLLLVHAASKEGFLLYSAMNGWRSSAIFGDTGWPCCVPGKDGRPGISTEHAVLADLDSKIPAGFSGRIWLLYSTRPTHWSYVGFDEGDLWRKHVWERGCPPGPYLRFENLAVSPMNCAAGR